MKDLIFEKNKNLSNYLSIKTPIVAEKFFIAKTREDLILAKKESLKKKIPLLILGGGTNIVALSQEFKGLVVKNEYRKFAIVENNEKFTAILVSSGYPVSLLVNKIIEMGLAGFEYFAGLPGTVGGAIYMNSKWTHPKNYFGDNLLFAYLIDEKGEVKKVNKEYFDFNYDYSVLQKTKEIVLEAVFKLKKDKKDNLKKIAEKVLNYRLKTQPKGVFTAGCFFRNISREEKEKLGIPTTSVGYLIDKAGLKGFKVGGFSISNVHANFIINEGSGEKKDLKKLISIIKKKIKNKFGLELKEEVILI